MERGRFSAMPGIYSSCPPYAGAAPPQTAEVAGHGPESFAPEGWAAAPYYAPVAATGPATATGPELVRILYVSSRPVNVWEYARTLEGAVREYCMPKLIAAVDVMRDGMEALNQATAADYDVIIICSDLPPPLTARELPERVKEVGVEAKLVLVVEGSKKKPSEEEAAQLGFDALLTPPLSRKSFSAGIAALVLGPEESGPVLAATMPTPLPPMPPARYWEGSLSRQDAVMDQQPPSPGLLARSTSMMSEGEGQGAEVDGMLPATEGWGQSEALRHIAKHISSEQAKKRSQKRARPPEWEAGLGYQVGGANLGMADMPGWGQPPPVMMQLG